MTVPKGATYYYVQSTKMDNKEWDPRKGHLLSCSFLKEARECKEWLEKCSVVPGQQFRILCKTTVYEVVE